MEKHGDISRVFLRGASGCGSRFGECVLRLSIRGSSLSAARPFTSRPRPFSFWSCSFRAVPKALSKSEIHDRLWPGTFVSEGTCHEPSRRGPVGDRDSAREPRFVRTVDRFGYAFSGASWRSFEGGIPPSGGRRFVYRLIWVNSRNCPRPRRKPVWTRRRRRRLDRRCSRLAPACAHRDRRDGGGSGRSRQQERDVSAREEDRSPRDARRRGPADDRDGVDDLPRLQADGLDGRCGREIGSPRSALERLTRETWGAGAHEGQDLGLS